MSLKAAFMFIAPEADPAKHQSVIDTPAVQLTVVGVKNYEAAIDTACHLVEKGIAAIELCAGFGVEGTALVKKAVKGKAFVGTVHFDIHPGLDNKSGDELFL